MELARALERGIAVLDPTISTADEALGALARVAASQLGVEHRVLHDALRRRERLCPTALPEGVALPHAILPGLSRTLVIPMLAPAGIEMDPLQAPSTVIIGLFGAEGRPNEHIALLGRIARAASDPSTLAALRAAPTAGDLVHVLLERDTVHA